MKATVITIFIILILISIFMISKYVKESNKDTKSVVVQPGYVPRPIPTNIIATTNENKPTLMT